MTGWDPIDVLSDHPYQVVIGKGVSGLLASFVDGAEQVAIVCSTKQREAAGQVGETLSQKITYLEVPDAEAAKSTDVLVEAWTKLAAAGFTRSDAIVGFGGGTVTDLAGFLAATWLRGVKFVAMPTTVLGMVDAAVGGKTGINLPAGKNLVGAFYEPYTVLGDLLHLQTLSPRELRSGFAEILKAGFIADPTILLDFVADLELSYAGGEETASLIRKAVAVKAKVVAQDFHEQSSTVDWIGREALNYGHTLAHAIELHQGYQWRHGEAVSIGMVFAAEVANRLGLISDELVAEHRQILDLAGLPTSYSATSWDDLRYVMNLDKKTRGRQLRLVLLAGLASPRIFLNPPEAILLDAFAAINN